LLLDISRSEDVLQIDPLLLANDPLFNDLVEHKEVLFPVFGIRSQGLHISATEDYVNSSKAFIKS
jgi:hypothetical protein